MTRTVDVVVAGIGPGLVAAASAAVARRQRVFVLLKSPDSRVARRLHRRLRAVARAHGLACGLERGVDVVCVDGIGGVEAVVYRHRRTGRLDAVNTSRFETYDPR